MRAHKRSKIQSPKPNVTAYREYFINDTYLKKLYALYIHQSKLEKMLDFLVLFAIIFTFMAVILEYLIGVSPEVLHIIHLASTFVLFIFLIDLGREYARSRNKKEFFKSHWIDVLLICVLSLYFLFVSYLGVAKATKELGSAQKMVKEAKHFRILLSLFKR